MRPSKNQRDTLESECKHEQDVRGMNMGVIEARSRERLLELRLHRLERENESLRKAMLERKHEESFERMALAQRRNLDLIATLQRAKESAERKSKRTQDRLTNFQVSNARGEGFLSNVSRWPIGTGGGAASRKY